MFSGNFRARTSQDDRAGWHMRTRPEWLAQRLSPGSCGYLLRNTVFPGLNPVSASRTASCRSPTVRRPDVVEPVPEGDPVFVDRRQAVLRVEAARKAPVGDRRVGASGLSLLSSFSVILARSCTSVAALPELRQMM